MSANTLTMHDAVTVSNLINATQESRNVRVRWVDENEIERSGIIRTITTFNGEMHIPAPDFRDQYLHVALDPMGEMYISIRTILDLHARGRLFIR